MKKRNKPIVLVTMLILMVGAVAFINFPKDLAVGGHGPNDGHNHGQEEAPQTGQQVNVPDKPSIAESVSSSITSKDNPKRMPTGRPGGPPGSPGSESESMIKIPKASQYKPKPNDSSTATQWYTEESMKEIPKD